MNDSETLRYVAAIFDDYTSSDGWDSCSITENVSEALVQAGYMTNCSVHGNHAAHLVCPQCDTCDSCGQRSDDCECCPDCEYYECECATCATCGDRLAECSCEEEDQ
jgi:hypothetical protein